MAAAVGTANAAYQGFNYGATFTDGSLKVQSDFENEFKTAASLQGTDGAFTSARLYTMIQGNTGNQPISAIPAAISTKTSLLFGLWASAGRENFNNEIAALKNTIDQYCGQIDDLVAGISVGSEDLYRVSPTGMLDNLPGTDPDTLVSYITETREAIKGSCLESVPIGHVDTWTAFANDSNNAVIDACDWLGMDAYPYFENTKSNSIDNGASLFKSALDKVKAAGGDKDVYITETGWPVSGDVSGDAVASLENARTFWTEVGCPMFGNTNVWWYTLQDSAPQTPNPSFGVIGASLTKTPLYDLSCDNADTKKGRSSSGTNAEVETQSSAEVQSETETKTETKTQAKTHTETHTETHAEAHTEAPIPTVAQTNAPKSVVPLVTQSVVPSRGKPNGTIPEEHKNSTVTATGVPIVPGSPTTLIPGSSSTDRAGEGSSSGSGSNTNNGDAAETPATTPVPASSGKQLNSFAAAAIAIVLAAAFL